MTMRPEPTEPRNPKSRCATCQHIGINPHYPDRLLCFKRDIGIYKGYTRCEDYLCEPKKIPYKNGDWVLYRRPSGTNAFNTQVAIVRDTNPKGYFPGIVILEPQPRRSNIGYLDTRFWEMIIRTLTPKEIEQYKQP